ncbi:unnamed protein product [Diabrotica balteata]|uniref:CUB domain-containing protein n=1 Tax=Diabrotica balteata TaxID=107213 RepID=A0A9N9T9I9_DIABA|nr:unnamed protein product [Diabrotica balteata]
MNLCESITAILFCTIFSTVYSSGTALLTNATCGGVFTANNFYLQSPNYPQEYPRNLNCVYVLKGPNCPTHYQFDFIDFDLENSVGCVKDRLIIENQDALCGKAGLKGNKGYFSNNGSLNVRFISDGNGTSRGFIILVTRLECENEAKREDSTTDITEVIDTTVKPESTTTLFRPLHLPLPNPEDNLPQCCLNTFNSRRSIITSPNFPFTLNHKLDCKIKIQKATKNICRLKLSFLFFWLGSANHNSCPYGWLRVDGKFICGCNQDLKLTTTFDGENVKELVFRSEGVNLNSQSGFVIEVIQDECPTKYYPGYTQSLPFVYRNSKFNRQNGVQQYNQMSVDSNDDQTYIETAELIHEKTEEVDNKNSSSKFVQGPKLIKSFYLFSEPNYNSAPEQPIEPEPTTFIDTSTVSVIVTTINHQECTYWNNVQMNKLCYAYGNNLQTCKRTSDSHRQKDVLPKSNCIELDYVRGYLKSPGYPFYYPKLLNTCYRFKKRPGYCGLQVFMADFQLQSSYGCYKDYLLVENQHKYCGKSLCGRYLTFDLTDKTHEDLVFVSDRFFCGRGFYATYEQLPCQTPTTTKVPDVTVVPIPTTPPTTSSPICDRYIADRLFIFEVKQDKDRCSFQIRKASQDVCKVNLYFENFDLFCGSESLALDNMMLCGHLTGRRISVNFDDYNELVTILYRSNLQNKYGDLKFRISGEQISDDCLIPEPPIQRLVIK